MWIHWILFVFGFVPIFVSRPMPREEELSPAARPQILQSILQDGSGREFRAGSGCERIAKQNQPGLHPLPAFPIIFCAFCIFLH